MMNAINWTWRSTIKYSSPDRGRKRKLCRELTLINAHLPLHRLPGGPRVEIPLVHLFFFCSFHHLSMPTKAGWL